MYQGSNSEFPPQKTGAEPKISSNGELQPPGYSSVSVTNVQPALGIQVDYLAEYNKALES